jgi:hypothetical protein
VLPSVQLFGFGIIEWAWLWPRLTAQFGVGMLMGAMVGPWARLGGDDFSDPHHKPLLAWPGVAKSPGAICKYSTMRFCSRDFWPTKEIWEKIFLSSISGRHTLWCAPLGLALTFKLLLATGLQLIKTLAPNCMFLVVTAPQPIRIATQLVGTDCQRFDAGASIVIAQHVNIPLTAPNPCPTKFGRVLCDTACDQLVSKMFQQFYTPMNS